MPGLDKLSLNWPLFYFFQGQNINRQNNYDNLDLKNFIHRLRASPACVHFKAVLVDVARVDFVLLCKTKLLLLWRSKRHRVR